MSHSKGWRYGDYKKLNYLARLIADNIEDMYEYFDVKYWINEKMIVSRCCIHGGDNTTALNFYHNSEYKFHFACRTHGCETHFKDTAIGFVRGALSNARHGWEKVGDKEVTFNETIEFLLDMFKLEWDKIDVEALAKLQAKGSEPCRKNRVVEKKARTFTREEYRNNITIPAQYYIDRGYSSDVLDAYDVGTCSTYGKPLYNRAVVPVYNETGEHIVGFSGRSVFDKQCGKCNGWHSPHSKCYFCPKWRHSKGFRKDKILYNYHKAKEHITKTRTAILVESPGNVWRLEEAGIHNSVAIFGTSFSSYQKSLLDSAGALTLVLLMDNDENGAGQAAAEKIKKQCESTYRVFIISLDKNDIGEMSTHEISKDIEPLINKTMKVYGDII